MPDRKIGSAAARQKPARPARAPAEEAPDGLGRQDRIILRALQADARLTTAELAEKAAMSTSPCWRKVKRLEEEGYITGYHATVDPKKLGYGVQAYVLVGTDTTAEDQTNAFEEAVRAMPEVLFCTGVSGSDDYILHVVARDLDDFYESVFNRIRRLPLVRRTQTMFAMKSVKASLAVPIP
ncbi:Lrp/AsnC family transcriptional regulator [Prosthecomicrobium sp. N25]|uniref:Lrp/AsnC family transcriptional regulator n=1 Tax=Prosthecomicrobium sp. N25 TaxID=3129254 RepID=UPI0030789586